MIVVRASEERERERERGGEPYLLTPGVLIEKHYIRVAVLCYKTYYLSRGVSSESVFCRFRNSCFGVCWLLGGVLSPGMPTAGIYLRLAAQLKFRQNQFDQLNLF